MLPHFFWTTQVLKNITHVTVSGAVATWYFLSANMPRNPTLSSFKRAVTYSLGSICFGSLLVAIIKTMRALLNSARRQGRDNIVACIAACLLSCIERLVEYINLYAFSYVATYGMSYCEAARAVWNLA